MKKAFLIIILVLLFILPLSAMWGGRALEHKPTFCISCHEMKPSFDGWIASGASKHHPDCIACHSQEGIWGAIDSEIRGLRFIKIHYFGKRPGIEQQALPGRNSGSGGIESKTRRPPDKIDAKVPEEYCIRCHSVGKLLESHKMFITRGHTCADCHQHQMNSKFSGELRP